MAFVHRLVFYKQNITFRELDLLPSSGEEHLLIVPVDLDEPSVKNPTNLATFT
jgi:hypothetical protein